MTAVLVGAVLAVVAVAWTSSPAQAHTLLTASTPADGATVQEAPTEALLTFSEVPDPVLSSVQVLDRAGKPVQATRPEAVTEQPMQLRVGLDGLAEGTYTMSWRVTSATDGHTTVGSVAFGVRVPAVAAGAEGTPTEVRTPAPTVASVAGRWLFYVGVVLLVGAAVVGVAVVSDPASISRSALGAAWVASAGGVALTIADHRAGARTSLAQLLSSSTGHKLTTQAVAVALAGVAVAWACLRRNRWSLAAVGLGAAGAMLARALAGHANASSTRWLGVGAQWVHLVSVGAWVGGLVWLLVAMRRGEPGRGRGLAWRFSSVAAGTLMVVAVSGAARALDEVGAWSRLFETSFGATLLVKFGLFAGLVALGARNRWRHVPAGPAGSSARLRRAVGGEVAIAAGVLGATALLAGLPPPASVAAASRARPATGGPSTTVPVAEGICGRGTPDPTYGVSIDSDPDPPRAEGTTFHLTVRREGQPVTGAKVCVSVDMPEMQHPGVSTVATEASPGTYDANLTFSMTGGWEGSVTIAEPGRRPASVPMTFEVT